MATPATPPPLSEALGQLDSLTTRGVLLHLALRGPATFDQLAAHPNDEPALVQASLDDLVHRGFVTLADGVYVAAVTGRPW
jgi:predicted ArsR family transcriptional regulator